MNLALDSNTQIQTLPLHLHTVKFFDSDEQRLQSIVDDVIAAVQQDAVTLVITPNRFHARIREEADRLSVAGYHLELLDAPHVMCQILVKKEASRERFDAVIRPQVMELIALAKVGDRPVRIYGDTVNSLCELGYHNAAVALEGFWHEFLEDLPPSIDLQLACGYMISNFDSAKRTEAFEKICSLHHLVLPLNDQPGQSVAYLEAKIRQQDLALRREIAEQERLQAIGEMSATVSHELANPLTSLIYSIDRLETWVTEQALSQEQIEFLRAHLDRARRSSNKLNEVNRNVLNLSRSTAGTAEVFLLQACIETTTSQTAYRIKEQGIQLQLDIPDAKTLPVFVNGSRTSIEQVLTNLLTNAADSIIERLAREPNSSVGKIELWVDQPTNSHAFIYVIDNGVGVADEAKDQIFQSFFTTKPVGKGTGIGLTFSQKVVRRHGGDLEYIDRPDFAGRPKTAGPASGACFRIRLPVTPPQD